MMIWRHPPRPSGPYGDDEGDSPHVDWTPPVDIYECPEELVVVLAVPGVGERDLEVSHEGNRLTVRGTREIDTPRGATPLLLETPRGSFRRTLRLPAGCDLDRASTTLEAGLLRVAIPRAQPRRIRVPIRTERSR